MINKLTSRWKFNFFVLLAGTVFFCSSVMQIKLGESTNSKYTIFSITFEYYGMDSEQIEELITIPLEEKLMIQEGLLELRSSVEYGKSITTAYFKKSIEYKKTYLNIRNEVDNLYANMPSDVQRPKILSSAADDKAILCIAFTSSTVNENMRAWLEKTLKNDMESIDGVAEIVVAGGKIEEIEVAFDADKVVALGQNPSVLSTIVRDGNSINAGSKIVYSNFERPVSFNTKLHSLDEIRNLPIKTDENYTTLGYFADVEKKPRLNSELVRINGTECVTFGVIASSNGNTIDVSKKCRKILEEKLLDKSTYQIIYDNGNDLEKIIHKTLIAMLESFLCILLITPFFYNSFKSLFLTFSFLCINIIWTIGILQIMGYSLNQNTLSGITIALGLIADSMFVINEIVFDSLTLSEFYDRLKKIVPSILSASLTTVLVLIPLVFMDEIVPGIKVVSITIGIMLCISVVLAISFFPSFIYENSNQQKVIISRRLFAKLNRVLKKEVIRMSLISVKYSKISKIVYVLFLLIPFICFSLLGKDLSFDTDNKILFCSVEFEPEYCAEYVDTEIAALVKQITEMNEVNFVRSEARKGSAEIEIGFDENLITRNELANSISAYERIIPSGFLYVPGRTERNVRTKAVEIAVVGDDNAECRVYAQQASELLGKTGLYDSIVLNFKRPEKIIELETSPELLNQNSISTEQVASSLRWMIFGPVADKWIEDGIETDIRIRGKGLQNLPISGVKNLYLPTGNGPLRIETLGTLEEMDGQGKIYRKDGRRCAYLTVEASYDSIDTIVSDLRTFLSGLLLKKGYGFSFPQEIENLSSKYNLLIITLIFSAIGVFVLLTIQTENATKSLLIVSIIPVTLALPMLIRSVTMVPLQLGDIMGMVILSGISVNNAVYLVTALKTRVIFRVRSKFSSIFVTSLTSIASSVPLLVISKENFSSSLAFFIVWGIIHSLFVCLILYPGVIYIKKGCKK